MSRVASGVLCERPRRARMAFAGFLHPRRLCDVPLLTARRRQRRVVRRLRRLAVLGLKFEPVEVARSPATIPVFLRRSHREAQRPDDDAKPEVRLPRFGHNAGEMQIPAHRGQSFRRIADSNPVIADSF
jgi:hypothetical protein